MSSLNVAKDAKLQQPILLPIEKFALLYDLKFLVRLRKQTRKIKSDMLFYPVREDLAWVSATNRCTPLQHTLSRGREEMTYLLKGSQRDVVFLLTNSALVYEPKCGGWGLPMTAMGTAVHMEHK
jgi:hypothetical protein